MEPVDLRGSRGTVVYVADVAGDVPDVADDDLHHLRRVLRLRDGADVVLCDGAGAWRSAVLGASVRPVGPVHREAAPPHRVTVCMPVVKGDRTDWAVQKATECGVDDVQLIVTERSVVTWSADKVARNVERLDRIARAAAAQSRRAFLPTVHGPIPFADAVRLEGAALAAPGGGAVAGGVRCLIVGPEGGFSDAEVGCGLPTVTLGAHVLRVETAAVIGAAMLAAARSTTQRG